MTFLYSVWQKIWNIHINIKAKQKAKNNCNTCQTSPDHQTTTGKGLSRCLYVSERNRYKQTKKH
jgi:hypothetical protein